LLELLELTELELTELELCELLLELLKLDELSELELELELAGQIYSAPLVSIKLSKKERTLGLAVQF